MQPNSDTYYTPHTMLTKDDLEQIGKVIDERLDAKVAAMIKASEKRMINQLKKTESVIVQHFDRRVGDHEKRITRIEDHLNLPRPE